MEERIAALFVTQACPQQIYLIGQEIDQQAIKFL